MKFFVGVSDNSGSDNVKSKPMKKKDMMNKENDMAMRVLLAISSSDDEDGKRHLLVRYEVC